MKPISEVQKNVCQFILNYSKHNGYPPTLYEITEEFEWNSVNAAQYHIDKLRQKGYINHSTGKKRCLQVIRELQ